MVEENKLIHEIQLDLHGVCRDVVVTSLPTVKGILWDVVKGCVFFRSGSNDYNRVSDYLEKQGYERTQVMDARVKEVDQNTLEYPYSKEVLQVCRQKDINTDWYNNCFVFRVQVARKLG